MTDPKHPTPADLAVFRAEVSHLCVTRFGCTWADLSGDDTTLRRALDDHESAADFTERFGEKYDLTRIDHPERLAPPRHTPPRRV
jgi:hypothetical protein